MSTTTSYVREAAASCAQGKNHLLPRSKGTLCLCVLHGSQRGSNALQQVCKHGWPQRCAAACSGAADCARCLTSATAAFDDADLYSCQIGRVPIMAATWSATVTFGQGTGAVTWRWVTTSPASLKVSWICWRKEWTTCIAHTHQLHALWHKLGSQSLPSRPVTAACNCSSRSRVVQKSASCPFLLHALQLRAARCSACGRDAKKAWPSGGQSRCSVR